MTWDYAITQHPNATTRRLPADVPEDDDGEDDGHDEHAADDGHDDDDGYCNINVKLSKQCYHHQTTPF